jgi:hypothetical protein
LFLVIVQRDNFILADYVHDLFNFGRNNISRKSKENMYSDYMLSMKGISIFGDFVHHLFSY